jgi:hypothetical protein
VIRLNFSITGSSAFEHIDENTISYSGVKFSDKVDVKLSQIDIVNKINESTSIEKDFVLFGFCTNDSGLNNFAIYKIKSLVKKGRSYNMTLQRINEHDDDNNELNFDAGNFICTVEDYVYDIPSGDSIGSVNILSAKANVYAQKHQPKYFVDTIQTKDIVTDESATEITIDEYLKQLGEAIESIKNGLKNENISFKDFVEDKKKVTNLEGKNIEYISINDLNNKFKDIGVILSDLKLSCLCSKYSLQNDLRLINIKSFEEDLESK